MDAANRIFRSGCRTSGGTWDGVLDMHCSRWWWLLLGLMVALPGAAREVAGVSLPERVELADWSEPLVLNGAGIRHKVLFSIYVAGLYLPARSQDPAAIAAAGQPSRVLMHFVRDGVTRDKLAAAWRDGFAANTPAPQLSALTQRLDTFISYFSDMRTGDQVWLDYVPAGETRVSINGVVRGAIPGADFNAALLRVWLGPRPVTDQLKVQLLDGG